MKIIFYADLYLVLNMMMNVFLLVISMALCQKKTKWNRIVLGAFLGSLLDLFMITQCRNVPSFLGLVIMCMETWIMVRCAFPKMEHRETVRCMIILYVAAVMLSGTISSIYRLLCRCFVKKYDSSVSVVFVLVGSLGITLTIYFLWQKIRYEGKVQNTYVEVTIKVQGKIYCCKALYDTGNHLTSPYTGKPVHIISRQCARTMNLENGLQKVAVPYFSIGGSGILWAYTVEQIDVRDMGKAENALLAVSDELCKDKEIQMILNCSLN